MNLTIIGDPYDEIRIGTQEDGLFVITNVPAPVDWYVYGKMESIAALGATAPVHCATTRDNEEVNVGDIESQQAIACAERSPSATVQPWPRACG